MKTRVIASAVLLPLLLVVVLLAPKVCTPILFGLVASLMAYELLQSTGLVRHGRLVIYSMLSAFLVQLWSFFGCSRPWGMLGVLVFFGLIFMEMMLSEMKLKFSKVAACFVAGLVLPYFLGSLSRIIAMEHGRWMIMIPFVVAFLSDSGAYFIGSRFGIHKLAPNISPKKSLEGMLGGILTAVLGMLIFVLVATLCLQRRVSYVYAFVYGVVGSVVGVFGDLCFSVIKRQMGIKDYGNLIPGHGGALDRFDSMLLVAPIVEVLLAVLPMVA